MVPLPDATAEFRILGPLEIATGTGRLELGGARQKIVLATLLLSANRVVTLDRLLEALYGGRLPATARSQAQITISSLRHLLASDHYGASISTETNGYIMNLDPERLDVHRFENMVAAARQAAADGRLEQAAASYRDALRLWRGPALAEIDSPLVQLSAGHLDEQRISIDEDRISLELDLGRHHELIGELAELVEKHPLRERLRGQLMLALYRSDRTADALQVFRQTRQLMVTELGIEPNERLRQLEHAILTGDPRLTPPGGPAPHAETRPPAPKPPAPSLLPTDIADFTGRAEQISRIRRHLLPAPGTGEPHAVPIVVLVGKGGIGKTSSSVHACHGIADRFPGGQLFADLHGGSHPVSPMQILERFLRALGVSAGQIPDTQEERAEAYRSLLADSQVLVLLDDAASESQVTPLLPGHANSSVMITSRTRLAGLPGAAHIEADLFDADRSVELLARIAGADRIRSEPAAAAATAELCGHLPLALRIAGARLFSRPHWSIQQLVDRLADETRRLDELRYGEMGIRASIALSYEGISPDARRLFRRLAVLDLPAFSGWMSAALLDQPLADAEDLLDDLINAQLIETTSIGSGVLSQYRFHDLIRVFARERLAAEEPADERTAALTRALGALLYLAEAAHCRQYGGDYGRLGSDATRYPLPEQRVERLLADPLAWYEHERAALVYGVRQAAHAGLTDLCWSLAYSADTLFESRIYLDDWRETHEIALDAARQAHNVRGQAVMLYSLGSLNMLEQRFGQARQELSAAAELFAQVDDDRGIALVVRHIAFLDRMRGRLDDATTNYERALDMFRCHGDQVAAAYVLHGLAEVKLERREFGQATELLAEALQLSQSAPSRRVEAQVLHRMGEAHLQAAEPEQAAAMFDQALRIVRELGDPVGEAYALQGAGVARGRLGQPGQARDALERAVALAQTAGERLAEARALLGLGELAVSHGDPRQAVTAACQASAIFKAAGVPLQEARALAVLSQAHTALGDADAADSAAASARALRAATASRPEG